MANDIIIPQNYGAISSRFTPDLLDEADEFSAGITGGFGILGFRGKVWRTKFRGEETPHLNADGTPKGAVDVVLVKSNAHLSKVYYENGYQEGSAEPPTCSSSNGVIPDAGIPSPQCATCAMCPHNQWGSRITESGKKGKACSDSKRAVIVPLDDMANEVYGGPMLLRVPAASLNDLSSYAQKMKGIGFPLFMVGTRLRFDVDAAYPKLVFSPLPPLSDEEVDYVLSLRDDPRVAHILNSADEVPASGRVDVEEPQAAPAPAPKPVAKAAPAPAPKPAPAPAQRTAPAARPPARQASPAGRPGGIAGAVANPQRAAPRPAPVPEPEPAPEEYAEDQNGAVPESFEAALDAQLDRLL